MEQVSKHGINDKGRQGSRILPHRGIQQRLHMLKASRRLHFIFMCLFSGLEFTLTFLTFDCEYLTNNLVERGSCGFGQYGLECS
jgi:hypothetical protein